VASVEGTRIEALSKVGSGEGCPLLSRLGCLGECHKLPQWGTGWNPGRNRILDIFLAHRQSEKCAEQLKNVTIVIWQNSGEARSIVCLRLQNSEEVRASIRAS